MIPLSERVQLNSYAKTGRSDQVRLALAPQWRVYGLGWRLGFLAINRPVNSFRKPSSLPKCRNTKLRCKLRRNMATHPVVWSLGTCAARGLLKYSLASTTCCDRAMRAPQHLVLASDYFNRPRAAQLPAFPTQQWRSSRRANAQRAALLCALHTFKGGCASSP